MSNWGTSDSGILRKNRIKENPDDLLVFGYSCKIFRDDEKALYIDKGKHLIPWMGDISLKIDRYDGRGTLSDLKQFEAGREGYDTLRWLGLSESEKKLEELCDKERYYSLEINEEEEEMYKEEAAKRQKTNAFAFDYNDTRPEEPEQPTEGIPTVPEKEEEDEPYKASPILDVPVNINIPKTVKEYARIEKTALFVCRQGLQMEILIKAKQADNPQFSFLTVQDPLYKFYRHVLSAFKNGRYQPQCDNKKSDEDKPATVSQIEGKDSHYLHPSLSANTKPDSPPQQNPPIPSVPYRPSADCAYSQLVNRIQGNGLGANGQSETVTVQQQQPNQMQLINQMSLEQQYHQFYYVQQFYDYWRHSVINSEQGAIYAGLPLDFSQLDTNMQTYIHQLAWAQFMQHHQQKQLQEAQEAQKKANDNSYAQIVSNLNKDGVNPYTANMPQLPLVPVVKEEQRVVTEEPRNGPNTGEKTVTLVKYEDIEVKKPLLSLAAAYGSGSNTDSDSSDSEIDSKTPVRKQLEEKKEVYRVPSDEMQTVIDKMAEYVAKNGENFEEIIKQKGDKRFDFLNASHEFNKYYKTKLRELKEPKKVQVKKVDAIKPTKTKPKKVVTPVSFSIKKPKEEPPKEIKSALPMEDSSDEESQPNSKPKSPINSDNTKVETVSNAFKLKVENTTNNVTSELPPQNQRLPIIPTKSENKSLIASKIEGPKKRLRSPSKSPKLLKSDSKTHTKKHVEDVKEKKQKSDTIDIFDVGDNNKKNKTQNGVLGTDDPILEMIELEMNEKTDDKASDAIEKARQLERKRKAAMFLKLKSVESKPVKSEKTSRRSPSVSSRRTSIDSDRSRSKTKEKSNIQEKLTSRHRSRSKEESRSQRSRSRERTRKHKKHKDKDRNRSRSRNRDSEDRRRREKKKKSNKRKHSKSKKKSKRPRSSSKHRSYSKSRSRSKSRSSSVKSHISIQDSS
ncbi:unnamed protein product [Ceutorhynchus assimilis]|uniref:SURP motif domain-containing protein n=1 Tax=Ceutorhynchus assimilis TaxID=467358 RepID=A0A9P0DHU2_9CUCU|nr:unnamed protein product [Ceutorhynchus assimilis]